MTRAEKIEFYINKGRLDLAKVVTEKLLLAEDKQEWDKVKRDEYDSLFPLTREATEDEKLEQYNMFKSIAEEKGYDLVAYEEFTADKINIDYSEDETYVTYEEWINETSVVSEAVEEVSTTDEDGITTITTQYQPEVTELVRPYEAIELTDELITAELDKYSEYKSYQDKLKSEAKENIVVEHNTVKYDGDPMSINFMSAVGAVGAMRMFQVLVGSGIITQEQYDSVYKTTETWKGATNEVHEVQIESVVEVCELAMQEQAKVIGCK